MTTYKALFSEIMLKIFLVSTAIIYFDFNNKKLCLQHEYSEILLIIPFCGT